MPGYEQKVNVEALKLGMFVSRLDRPWLETRFLFQGFHISSDVDMQQLRSTCEYVFVDPERGEAPDPGLHCQMPEPGERVEKKGLRGNMWVDIGISG